MTKFPLMIFNHEITNATEADSWIGILKGSIQMLEVAIRRSTVNPELQEIVDGLNARADNDETLLYFFNKHSNTISLACPSRFCVSRSSNDITWYYPDDEQKYECNMIDSVYKISFDATPELLYERKESQQ